MEVELLLKKTIRNIPDFPRKGIMFRDITPLLSNPDIFEKIIESLVANAPANLTHVAGIEARGFLFGIAIATKLGLPFVPIRKKGKLPYQTFSVQYELEYGIDSLYMHTDALAKDSQVYLIDDLIATGGSLAAAIQLVKKCEARVVKIACVIELSTLNGRKKFATIPVTSLISY